MTGPLLTLFRIAIGICLCSGHLRYHVVFYRLDRACDDVHAGPFYTVPGDVFLHPQPSCHIDRKAFLDAFKGWYPLVPFPGCHVVPGCVDDRLAIAVFLGEVRGNREMGYPCVTDVEDVDVPDIPSDFDSVQLFHSSGVFDCFVQNYIVRSRLTGF